MSSSLNKKVVVTLILANLSFEYYTALTILVTLNIKVVQIVNA